MSYSRTPSTVGPPDRYWTAADRSFLAESYSGELTVGQSAPSVVGRLEFVRLKLPNAASVTNIVMAAQAGGSALTAGQCFAVLYDSASARVGVTADQAAAWATSGIKTMALVGGPFSLAAGQYFVGFWYNGTTSPSWHRASSLVGSVINSGRSSPNYVAGVADTGLTTTSPATMGTQTANTAMWYAALS